MDELAYYLTSPSLQCSCFVLCEDKLIDFISNFEQLTNPYMSLQQLLNQKILMHKANRINLFILYLPIFLSSFYPLLYLLLLINFISNHQFWCYKTNSLFKNSTKGAFTLGVKDSSIKSPNTKLVIQNLNPIYHADFMLSQHSLNIN